MTVSGSTLQRIDACLMIAVKTAPTQAIDAVVEQALEVIDADPQRAEMLRYLVVSGCFARLAELMPLWSQKHA